MKQTLYTALIAVVLISCSTAAVTKSLYGNTYRYDYVMVDPAGDSTLRFEDDNLRFDFTITNQEVDFVVKNKSNTPLKLIWDEASMVVFGKAQKVMHKGIKYTDRNLSQPPTTIPPQATWSDLVLPTENVYWKEGYYSQYSSIPGGWKTQDLFLTNDMNKESTKQLILQLVGQEISVYLPVRNPEGKEIGYNFRFKVSNITCTTCKP